MKEETNYKIKMGPNGGLFYEKPNGERRYISSISNAQLNKILTNPDNLPQKQILTFDVTNKQTKTTNNFKIELYQFDSADKNSTIINKIEMTDSSLFKKNVTTLNKTNWIGKDKNQFEVNSSSNFHSPGSHIKAASKAAALQATDKILNKLFSTDFEYERFRLESNAFYKELLIDSSKEFGFAIVDSVTKSNAGSLLSNTYKAINEPNFDTTANVGLSLATFFSPVTFEAFLEHPKTISGKNETFSFANEKTGIDVSFKLPGLLGKLGVWEHLGSLGVNKSNYSELGQHQSKNSQTLGVHLNIGETFELSMGIGQEVSKTHSVKTTHNNHIIDEDKTVAREILQLLDRASDQVKTTSLKLPFTTQTVNTTTTTQKSDGLPIEQIKSENKRNFENGFIKEEQNMFILKKQEINKKVVNGFNKVVSEETNLNLAGKIEKKTERQSIKNHLVIKNLKHESYDFDNRNEKLPNGNIKNYKVNEVETTRKLDNTPLETNKRDEFSAIHLDRFGLKGKASGRHSQTDHVYQKERLSQQNTNSVDLEHGLFTSSKHYAKSDSNVKFHQEEKREGTFTDLRSVETITLAKKQLYSAGENRHSQGKLVQKTSFQKSDQEKTQNYSETYNAKFEETTANGRRDQYQETGTYDFFNENAQSGANSFRYESKGGTGNRQRSKLAANSNNLFVVEEENSDVRKIQYDSKRTENFFGLKSSEKLRVENGLEYEKRQGFENNVKPIQTYYSMLGFLELEHASNRNIFFSKDTITKNYYNSNSELINASKAKIFDLSIHSKSALNTAKLQACSLALNNLFSTSTNRISPSKMTAMIAKASSETFINSVINEKFIEPISAKNELAGALLTGGVSAGFKIIHGQAAEAAKIGFISSANYILQQASKLPISYSHSMHGINAGSFHGHQLIGGLNERHNLDYSFSQTVSLGLHQEFSQIDYIKNGFTIRRDAYSNGVHASVLGVVDASVGFSSGYEIAEPKVTYVGELKITENYEKIFSTQLQFKLRSSDRENAINILPALITQTHTSKITEKADGSPLYVRENLHNRNDSLFAKHLNKNPNSIDLKEIENKSHQEFVEALFNPVMKEAKTGREEKVLKNFADDKSKKILAKFVCSENVNEVHDYGEIKERNVLQEQVIVSNEIHSSLVQTEYNSVFDDLREKHIEKRGLFNLFSRDKDFYYKPGEQRNETKLDSQLIKDTIISKEDGSAFESNVDLGEIEFGELKIQGKATADLYV